MQNGRFIASSTSDSLEVCETFVSICGESSWQGLPAFFVRTSGCNLRCRWCDTAYAWEKGTARSVESLVREAEKTGLNLAVLTGGEPLLQPAILRLCKELADRKWAVLVETNGTRAIAPLDRRVIRIVDIKPPSAAAAESFLMENLADLRPADELKFVVADQNDFQEAVRFINRYHVANRCRLLISPVFGQIDPARVAEWILAAGLPLRLQLQLHKILWGEGIRGR